MPKNGCGLYWQSLKTIKGKEMTRCLKVLMLLVMLAFTVGCGQKGDLYLPTEQTAKHLGE